MVGAVISIVVFLALMLGIGVAARKLITRSADYLLAGREMSLSVNTMGLVASGFAGTSIALAPSFTVTYGLFGGFCFAFGYSIIGVLLYGLFFARTVRRSGAYTIAEWLEMRFDKRVRRVLSFMGLFAMIALTANNVLALANVLTGYFGISLYVAVAVGVVTFLVFTYLSGMWGVSLTDFVQALIGVVGCPLVVIMCIKTFGGFDVASSTWTEQYNATIFSQGISGLSMPGMKLTYPSWLTSFFAFGVFLVWGAQHYWIRGASARSESAARNAFMVGAIFLLLINIIIALIGLYAGAFNGSVFTLLGGKTPTTAAYGATIVKFPAAAGVFLLVFALAASLSTCASVLMASVTIAAKDIYPLFKKVRPTDAETTTASRVATIVLSLAAWGLAYYPGGTAFLSAFATSWLAPAGLLFVIGFVWRRCTPTAAFITAVIAIISASIYTILDLFKIPIAGRVISSYFHLSALLVIITIFFALVLSFATKPKYYGRPDWTLKG